MSNFAAVTFIKPVVPTQSRLYLPYIGEEK